MGSRSSTATRVAGSVKLNASTPRRPSQQRHPPDARARGAGGHVPQARLVLPDHALPHVERGAHAQRLVALEGAPEHVAAGRERPRTAASSSSGSSVGKPRSSARGDASRATRRLCGSSPALRSSIRHPAVRPPTGARAAVNGELARGHRHVPLRRGRRAARPSGGRHRARADAVVRLRGDRAHERVGERARRRRARAPRRDRARRRGRVPWPGHARSVTRHRRALTRRAAPRGGLGARAEDGGRRRARARRTARRAGRSRPSTRDATAAARPGHAATMRRARTTPAPGMIGAASTPSHCSSRTR